MCGLIPEFKLIYHYEGVTRVEKYCKVFEGRIPNQEKGRDRITNDNSRVM